jgi:hypothetical protein
MHQFVNVHLATTQIPMVYANNVMLYVQNVKVALPTVLNVQ